MHSTVYRQSPIIIVHGGSTAMRPPHVLPSRQPMQPSPPVSSLASLTLGPSPLPPLLLSDSIAALNSALSTQPSGLLLVHSDPQTLSQLVRLTLPHSIHLPPTHPTLPSPPPPPSTPLCFTNIDAPVKSLQPSLNAIFTRRPSLSNPFPILATASHLPHVPPSLLRAGRFEKILHIPLPTLQARITAWRTVFQHWTLFNNTLQWTDTDITDLATISPGYGIREFSTVLGMAQTSPQTMGVTQVMHLVRECRARVGSQLPFVEEGGARQCPRGEGWDDVGGYQAVKRVLERLVEWPVRYRHTFDRLAIKVPKGLLLYGPGGCGKSMLVMCFLRRLKRANWMRVCGGDLFSKWFGESEARVRRLFERARQLMPCVVFVDELDVVGGQWRGEDEAGGVERRVLGALLTEMDGIGGAGVFVVACASALAGIDAALLRPGRLDYLLEMGLPSLDERADILGRMLKGVHLGQGRNGVIREIATQTEGMSGAELKAVCTEAGMLAIEERDEPDHVSWKNLMDAVTVVRGSGNPAVDSRVV